MKKVSSQDVKEYYKGLPAEQRDFMEKNADMMAELVNKAIDGILSPDDLEKKFLTINEKLSDYEALKARNDELQEVVKNLSEAYEKAKKRGVSPVQIGSFVEKFNQMMDSAEMKEFVGRLSKSTGTYDGFNVKEISNITSVTDNYDGDTLISYQSDRMVSPFSNPKLSIRDVITTVQGDTKFPTFTYLRIKNFDRNARYETENGRLNQSTLDVEEISTSIRRVGTYFDLSENLLLARLQLQSFIIANIPGIITTAENSAILFGDGSKSQLLGITNIPGVQSIEAQITSAIVTGAKGDVESVESHNNGKDILVTLNKPVSNALSSMMIKFTGAAVNTSLLSAHPIVKLNDRQLIVLNAAYTGEETGITSMEFTINHSSFKSIESPNSKDVVRTIIACLSFAQYNPTAIILNPLTLCSMEGEKDTTGRDLNLVQIENGVKYINGIPVIECGEVPVGYYLAGDFKEGAQLYDYTKLGINFVRDAETALCNMVRLIAAEQLALVVYMPWSFAYGSIEALKTAITKDQVTTSTSTTNTTTTTQG